ncbi:hypothetical protein [Caulobacter sp.]|uniref:hypothetical protein n=1 Tax=Caulobacter sp. TaxID=78 RepID=UPI003BA94585
MPRSRTRARLYPRPAPAHDPAWPKARRARLYREFDKRIDKLFALKALDEARDAQVRAAKAAQVQDALVRDGGAAATDEGPAPREAPCEAAAITPSMPR